MTGRKRHQIKVYTHDDQFIETIKRVLTFVVLGNWNPAYCVYKREKYQVHSVHGDMSDPFRRDESYLDSLYIKEAH